MLGNLNALLVSRAPGPLSIFSKETYYPAVILLLLISRWQTIYMGQNWICKRENSLIWGQPGKAPMSSVSHWCDIHE